MKKIENKQYLFEFNENELIAPMIENTTKDDIEYFFRFIKYPTTSDINELNEYIIEQNVFNHYPDYELETSDIFNSEHNARQFVLDRLKKYIINLKNNYHKSQNLKCKLTFIVPLHFYADIIVYNNDLFEDEYIIDDLTNKITFILENQ